jgi:N-terminal domain of galactosyltransferase
MGRLEHLRETLPLNLKSNQQTPFVEFVLLDYSSLDGLKRWVEAELKEHLSTGRVAYYLVTGFKYFHHAHAKNIAHRLARGKIVCNLDADNFTGFGFAEYLIKMFSNNKRILVRSPKGINGPYGRIALRKIDFEAIGGYDERMEFGWGFEDDDFINRAVMSGIEECYIPVESSFLTAIQHGDLDRTKFTKAQQKKSAIRRHKLLSSESIGRSEFIANIGRQWGAANVTGNFMGHYKEPRKMLSQ